MKNLLYLLSLILLVFFSNCGLEQMAMNYHKVEYSNDKNPLELHSGKVKFNLLGKFPAYYFPKKANLVITPVIVCDDNYELPFDPINLQGESMSGGDATIFNESGGEFSQVLEFDFMEWVSYGYDFHNLSLELRAIASLDTSEIILDTVKLSSGLITTSNNLYNCDNPVFASHNYDDTTFLESSAIIYFLVNKSNIRTSEKSDDDVKKLQDFIKNGYETARFEIRSYASPEGDVNWNDELSDNRNESTLSYAKQLMRQLRADGSSDNDKYVTVSVGGDFDGFYNLVKSSSIDDKSMINRIVKSNKTDKQREQAIRDMAEVYDAIDNDILPFLRKAEITIKAYQPKRQFEDMKRDFEQGVFQENHVNELLYLASKFNDSISMQLYGLAAQKYNSWEAYNNLAALLMTDAMTKKPFGDIYFSERISQLLDSARVHSGMNGVADATIRENLSILSSWSYDFSKDDLFDNYSQIDFIRKGDYFKAISSSKNFSTYNYTLAKILSGENILCDCANITNSKIKSECHYLNAISYARQGNVKNCVNQLSLYMKFCFDCKSMNNRILNDDEFKVFEDNEDMKGFIEKNLNNNID